ncbi:hypothetical protein [Stutzerimonas zhaodongensis]|uniref:Uncharacterized protein n=1 Tax=Stutzerimonas zhaodongensis TaxID=1176257 RepID=A0A365PSA1_9GAMM|nr:hypothetical protein [Stutzerimonas zhaodongensis]RBA54741.1 hypothetical protein DQ403_17315 [Stutzerimonas zhaodongensis]
MAIHHSVSEGTVACGRSGSNLTSTHDSTKVSCKLCLRTLERSASEPVRKSPSLAELRAAAKSAKHAKAIAEESTPTPSISPRAEWHQRLAQLPGRNRLPRGAARQVYI